MSEYDVIYETKKSYYDLFKAAGISWKKTTKLNPKAEPNAVAVKKKRLRIFGCKQKPGFVRAASRRDVSVL